MAPAAGHHETRLPLQGCHTTRSQLLILCTLWLAYASFYLGRLNISVALPGLRSEYNWTAAQAGAVASAFYWSYLAGLLLNGQLAERLSARISLPIALGVSAAINVLLATQNSVLTVKILWAANGYVQAFAWPLVIKTLALWFPARSRGRAAAAVSTSYILGGAISVGLAGYFAGRAGWRSSFLAPAGLMILVAVGIAFVLRDQPPEDLGLTDSKDPRGTMGVSKSIRQTLWQTIRTPRLRLLALSLLFLNLVRYGFLLWAPSFLFEVTHVSITKAAFSSLVFPLAGCAGVVGCGWLSDRMLAGRRAPIAFVCLVSAGLLTLAYRGSVLSGNGSLGLIVLGVIGAGIFGAHMLIVGVAPMDFAFGKTVASATGFVDSIGYVGVAANTVLTGVLVDVVGWNAVFNSWTLAAFVSAAFLIPLWHDAAEAN